MSSEHIVFRPTRRRPGLHAIARELGVSHTAVSRALRGDRTLSEKLRQDVAAVAQREGYFPSNVVQGLVSGRSGAVGVVLPTLDSYFVGQMANSIAAALWEEGIVPMTLCSELEVEREEKMLAALAQKRVDGLIIMPSREDRGANHFCHLLARHTPIVVVDTGLPRLEAPLVSSDMERGAAEATRHLIRCGHRHILHLACALDSDCADRRRENGYRLAMKEAGLRARVIRVEDRRPDSRKVIAQLERFIASGQGRKTTAVFAFNDYPLAYCVCAAAARVGRVIGEDLAVIGFGNFRGLPIQTDSQTDALEPTLSSVEQHPAQMGRTAAALLMDMMRNKPVPRINLIEPTVIVRASSRRAFPDSA